LVVGASNNGVSVVGTEFWNFATGWQVEGLASVPETGGNISLVQLKSYRCTTGAQISPVGGGSGTIMFGLHVRDCIADDQGAGVTTSGLILNGSVAKQVVDFHLIGCDFTKLASGGAPVTYNSATGPAYPGARWRDVRGITDQGSITDPFGTTTINEMRNNGTTATPVASTNYKINARNPTVASSGGTGVSITVQHPDGTTLNTLTSAGSTGVLTASQWYQVQGAAATVTSSGGTGVLITAVGPDGTVLINYSPSCPATVLPVGSYITWRPFSVAPSALSVVVGGLPIASPFAPLSALATLPSTQLLWGSNINFGAFSAAPTVTLSENGTSASTPFLVYRDLSTTGAGAAPVSGTLYEVHATAMTINSSGGTGVSIALTDPFNHTIVSGLTTLTAVRLEPGFRIKITFTGAPTVVVAVSPA
jgi:hypothetical protein